MWKRKKIVQLYEVDEMGESVGLGSKCPNCGEFGGIEWGGEIYYVDSAARGLKFSCSKCGAKGIAWHTLELAEWELVEPDSLNIEGDEKNIPLDDNF